MSNVKISTFSPYNDNSVGSFQFNGGTLNAVLTDGITAIGTDSYTLEMWVYHTSITGQQTYVSDTQGNTNGVYFYKNSSHQIGTYYTSQIATSGTTIGANRWYHVAVVRNGTALKQYINGVEAGTATDSTNLTDTAFSIGDSAGTTSAEMIGFISDVRLVVGNSSAAIYTSAFTPPTTALTNVSGTGYSTYVLMQPGNNANLNRDTAAPEDRKVFAAISAGIGQEPQTVINEGTSITSSGADTATYNYQSAQCVPALPEGKWYFEVRDLFYYLDIGLMPADVRFDEGVGSTNYISYGDRGPSLRFAPYSGKLRLTPAGGTSNDDYHTLGIETTGTAPGTGDIFGIDYDTVTNTFGVSKNGGTRYTHVIPTSDFVMLGKRIGMSDGSSSGQGNLQINFGQNPTFNGNITPSGGTNSDGSYPDADGIGGFRYAPPTGYKALRFVGPSRPAGLNKAALAPDKHFDTVLYSGTGAEQRIGGLGFQPDLVWIKGRNQALNHVLFDSVRGKQFRFHPDLTNTEARYPGSGDLHFNSFNSDGFTVDNNSGINQSSPATNYVAWCWKAGEDSFINTDGTIDSECSVNQDAGFSIVSWVGSASDATIGHGLRSAPELFIVKNRADSSDWRVGQTIISGKTCADGNGYYLELNATKAVTNPGSTTTWGATPTNPTSSVFSVGSSNSHNGSNDSMIAYCWHSVEGYSKFGTYVGNGNAEGPFVYLGFKPAWLMIKHVSGSVGATYTSWLMVDNKRDTYNPTTNILWANRSVSEGYRGDGTSALTGNIGNIDFLSNGFKVRDTSSDELNDPSDVYIYMAFAETPSAFTNSR